MKHLNCFHAAEILLPDFEKVNGTLWSAVACDQYTSEPEYWERADATVGNAPSTLRLMLPELYLEDSERRIPLIHAAMKDALEQTLVAHPNAMIYLERTQSDGRVRRGIVGAVDLNAYDYHKGSTSPIRATEGTVLERIPPRVAVRRDAPLELPHVMLLIDDPKRTVVEACVETAKQKTPVYDFDLMLDGGHVKGYLLTEAEQAALKQSLEALVLPDALSERYGDGTVAPLLFAVGDGNHSLATAKASFEEIRREIGDEAAQNHPARYALAEVVNLHDDALEFEPIYRVLFGVDKTSLVAELEDYLRDLHGDAAPQRLLMVSDAEERWFDIPAPLQQLAVGTLQTFLDAYLKSHPTVKVDYIHGEDSLRRLASEPNAVGFLFDGMRKDELFRTVIRDGALPRKTFSMGHAQDKRYYLECRKIR